MKPFGVRCYAEKDESFAGYLLRIANVNGLTGTQELLNIIRFPLKKQRSLSRWSDDDFKLCLKHLAPWLNRDINVCAAPFIKQRNISWLYSESRMIRDLRIDFPRICLSCLTDRPILDWRWGLAHIANCNKHHVHLCDTCPRCEHRFEWNSRLLECCPNCKVKWKNLPAQSSTSPTPELEMLAWETAAKTGEEAGRLIDDLCATITVIARPLDTMHQPIQVIPYIHHYSTLVAKAYAVLNDELELMRWLDACRRERCQVQPLLDNAVYAPVVNLQQLLSNQRKHLLNTHHATYTNDNQHSIPDYVQFVKLARQKLVVNNGINLRFHVNSHKLAELMNLPSNEVQHLVDRKVITPINSTNVLRDQLFDIRELVAYLSKAKRLEHNENEVSIGFKSKCFKQHFTRYGKLLADLLCGSLDGHIRHDTQFQHVYLAEVDLTRWLKKQLQLACDESLSISSVKTALKCSDDELSEMVKKSYFAWAKWTRGPDRVDGLTLYQHINDNRS